MPYYACVYATPSDTHFTLGGVQVTDGSVVSIDPAQSYSLQANPPEGYAFGGWSQTDGVHIADVSGQSTTVSFDATTRPTCVGNLSVNYTQGGGGGGGTAPTLSTDKGTYAFGDLIQFTGTGYTPTGPVTKCITSNGPKGTVHICAGDVLSDTSGNVSGSFEVGDNIPVGPQDFILQDKATGLYSQAVTVTVTADITPPPPPAVCSEQQISILGNCVTKNVVYGAVAVVAASGIAYFILRRRRKRSDKR